MSNTAKRLGLVTNLAHGFIYFANEAAEEYAALGVTDRAAYFGSRAAAMGPVGPEMVVATFFNFNPEIVHAAVPSVWETASADDLQAARLRAASRVLERCCGDLDDAAIDEASKIAGDIVAGVGFEGKPLAAANSAVALPDDRLGRLWQQITVIREWRGDAHIGVLTQRGVTAVQALVLHAGTGVVSKEALVATRQWPEAAWDAAVGHLSDAGLCEADGSLTDAGADYRRAIEDDTNRACRALVDAVGDDRANRLSDLLDPVKDRLLASGVFPHIR